MLTDHRGREGGGGGGGGGGHWTECSKLHCRNRVKIFDGILVLPTPYFHGLRLWSIVCPA